MPSYTKLKQGNWQVTISLGFNEDGKRIRCKKQGFRTKADAEAYASDLLTKKNKGYTQPLTNNILFKDFLEDWFINYKKPSLSITTYYNYRSRIDTHILPNLGNYKLKDISNITVQNFYNKLIIGGLSASSAKKVMEILTGCFKYAKKNKLIYTIPTDIEKQKLEKPIVEFWNQDEIDYYLNSIKENYLFTPVLITLLTGIRVAELCGLRWLNVDLDNRVIHIKEQVIQDKENKILIHTNILKTSKSYRSITIPKILRDYLHEIYKSTSPKKESFVILDREGHMCNPRNISMNFTKNIEKYKYTLEEYKEKYPNKNSNNYKQLKQICFHGLRHTHATILIKNGENIKVVSDRLGHENITTTLQSYTHIMEEMKNNTADLLDTIFKNTML